MTIVITIDGQFCTATVGQETVRTVCTAGTVAVVVAVAVVVTVAVAVAVAAAVAGGQCPPCSCSRVCSCSGSCPLLQLLGHPVPPLPTDSPESLTPPTSTVVYGDGPHVAPCPACHAKQIEEVPGSLKPQRHGLEQMAT